MTISGGILKANTSYVFRATIINYSGIKGYVYHTSNIIQRISPIADFEQTFFQYYKWQQITFNPLIVFDACLVNDEDQISTNVKRLDWKQNKYDLK